MCSTPDSLLSRGNSLTRLFFNQSSNIADRCYLGLQDTAVCLGPLLQSPADNPHATLIMTFMNAAKETYILSSAKESKPLIEQEMDRLKMYLPPPLVMSPADMGIYIFTLMSAREMVWDIEKFFNLFVPLYVSALNN